MSFCTQCGHNSRNEARFCEQCGTPLAVKPQATASASIDAQAPQTGAKRTFALSGAWIKRLAFGGVLLVGLVGGMLWLLAPQAPSKERFAKIIEQALATKPDAYKWRYCYGKDRNNVDYSKDVVNIAETDAEGQRWMTALTRTGLYGEPEVVMESAGYFVSRQWAYTKTDLGKQATSNGLLCIAEGVLVDQVEAFTPPQKVGDLEVTQVTFSLKLKNPAPWLATLRTFAPELKPERPDTAVFMRKDGKWAVADDRAVEMAAEAQRNPNQSAQSQAGQQSVSAQGIFSFLSGLFNRNPVLGRWISASSRGGDSWTIEFAQNSVIWNGQRFDATYTIDGDHVMVYNQQTRGKVFDIRQSDQSLMVWYYTGTPLGWDARSFKRARSNE